MAHFAEIDKNNKVIRVLVTSNDKPNEGYDWLVSTFGGTWVKTSYNTIGNAHLQGGTPLRANFAGVGFTYDAEADVFIPPQPTADGEWVLNTETYLWENAGPHIDETVSE